MDLKETEISSQPIFKGRIVDLSVRTIELPNGETATREVVKHQPASAVIAINDKKQMLLVKQWREAIKQLTLEVPAGLVDSTDASPLDAMKRELNEEGGYRAEYWEKVTEFYTSPGFADEKIHLFYCDTLTKLEDKRSLDEDEFLIASWYGLDDLKKLISEGKIVDLKTIFAITFWENMLLNGKQVKENDD
ncbi:NUDIX hydrolase [Lactobacillus hamsteri]|uniref:ADP ribose pyrophosphatase n=1 Tax=Lactobacillus hamsteri DSM 5661 = JCM 6256 TaxID=1423754 RepID=A0A0R1YBN6_9LACO|nr:NUDIX hydrolase [Lactobacillus hamsteri]KRM37211.1 ADP ribose pyrophosphatase [Lactobacillus hamsteri DSM 5661 = JCM 6256]